MTTQPKLTARQAEVLRILNNGGELHYLGLGYRQVWTAYEARIIAIPYPNISVDGRTAHALKWRKLIRATREHLAGIVTREYCITAEGRAALAAHNGKAAENDTY